MRDYKTLFDITRDVDVYNKAKKFNETVFKINLTECSFALTDYGHVIKLSPYSGLDEEQPLILTLSASLSKDNNSLEVNKSSSAVYTQGDVKLIAEVSKVAIDSKFRKKYSFFEKVATGIKFLDGEPGYIFPIGCELTEVKRMTAYYMSSIPGITKMETLLILPDSDHAILTKYYLSSTS